MSVKIQLIGQDGVEHFSRMIPDNVIVDHEIVTWNDRFYVFHSYDIASCKRVATYHEAAQPLKLEFVVFKVED